MVSHRNPLMTHEAVYNFHDQATGVQAVIAVHSTTLGPAAGGCRVLHYDDYAGAVQDAMRLSEGMAYKNALAGLPFGGGKAVIMLPENADAPDFDRNRMFRTFGRWVDSLDGAYVTAEDVGCSVEDMQMVATETGYVSGLPSRPGLAGGNPGPWTAKGVFLSIEALVRHRFGSDLKDVVVGVQGLGHVGFALCELLHQAGAKLLVSDLNGQAPALAAQKLGAEIVKPEKMQAVAMDVFAPCALGNILTETTIPLLKAAVVCGAANNQLATAMQGQQLADRGVLYAPDYLVNAGGIINVAAEYLRETTDSVESRVAQIPHRLMQLVRRSEAEKIATNVLADRMAQDIVAAGQPSKVA
ncbi:Leu/Phe/Val dehydrogenase [Parasphingorhabdus sp.]|uniref:Leu/Phe/Val dehydrogenase n=1 Tax=Parasphingorhabdus sp. TaxID=2709688 RepID=UPI003001B300